MMEREKMAKTEKRITGDKGEDEACEFLISKGYKIIGRNVKLVCGEVDILAQDKKSIVIVEVKSVTGTGFGSAQELVRFKKQNKLKQLARALEQKYPGRTIRIDVVGVEFASDKPEIEHLINCVN
jgi:putative endonuclease